MLEIRFLVSLKPISSRNTIIVPLGSRDSLEFKAVVEL